jgi:hypothetical protein
VQRICDSLSKSSCLQRISLHCQECVDRSKLAFSTEVEWFCSESAFAVESVLTAAKM